MDGMQYSIAIEYWHHDITDDQVWLMLQGHFNTNLTIGSSKYFIIGQFKDFSSIIPDIVIVFYQQQCFHAD